MNRKKIFALFIILFLLVFIIVSIKLQHGAIKKEELFPAPERFSRTLADIAEELKPAVVNIRTVSIVRIPGNPFEDFFGRGDDFLGSIPDRQLKQRSLGSGFIIDKEGYIVTNDHVVEGTLEIKVMLSTGNEYEAKVVGRDPKTDLALIKISTFFKDLPPAFLGD
jgi:serine protease Do